MPTKTGCLKIQNKVHKDDRGYFFESCTEYMYKVGKFVQDNASFSKKGTVRGMHYQEEPMAQGKFVRVMSGEVLDVVIDLREGSSTYNQMEEFVLSPTGFGVYVPPGFAHGFWALKDSIFTYKCTKGWSPDHEKGINPLSKKYDFPWIGESGLTISNKDLKLPYSKESSKDLTAHCVEAK